MTILIIAFAAAAVIFGVFGLSLYRGAIGLIRPRYWQHIPEELRLAYCRRMGIGTIVIGAGFLAGALGALISGGQPENARMLWGFGALALVCLPGVLLILITNDRFSRKGKN